MIEVRRATAADFPALGQVDWAMLNGRNRSYAVYAGLEAGNCMAAFVPGPGGGGGDGSTIAGLAIFDYSFFGSGWISLLIVHHDHRRRGVAKALLGGIEKICVKPKLFTSTNQSNLGMQAVMASAGYQPSGIVQNIDPDDPELIYFKPLPIPRPSA